MKAIIVMMLADGGPSVQAFNSRVLDGHLALRVWLPVVCDRAASLLESAQLRREPPTIVEQTSEAVSWLSQAVVDLDQDSPEAASTLAETLARLLTVWVFADQAADHRGA